MSEYNFNFWDERFASEEYIYGTDPNQFFKEQLSLITSPGNLLLPGEGEGRNAVYAATLGWKVDAFDQSEAGKNKAIKLADEKKVPINYVIADIEKFNLKKNYYDCAAIIFVHLSPAIRIEFHEKIISSLKPGGKIILELFSKDQLGKSSGGPQDSDMLYSIEDANNDFMNIKTILLNEKNIFLDEGDKHSGEASVIRFVGIKEQ